MLTADQIVIGTCTDAGCTGGLWGFFGLSGLALTTSAVILAFIYVWASLFRNAQLNAYVKQELFEVFATTILIIAVFGSVKGMSDIKVGLLLPPSFIPGVTDPDTVVTQDTTIYSATERYYRQVDKDMQGWLQLNYFVNMYVDQMASVTPYARPLGVGLVASPLAGFAAPIKQLLYNMTVALSMAYIINWAQLIVYIFSLEAFLSFYMPLGVFLRSFTPTRRLGGTLIGVSVSFLFVFPLLSVMTYGMFYGSAGGALLSFRSVVGSYVGDANFLEQFKNFFSENFTGGITDLVGGLFSGIGTVFQKLIGGALLMLMIFPISVVSWAFAIGFVVPMVNVLLFTQAARGLSKSFGEEVDISSLTRMI